MKNVESVLAPLISDAKHRAISAIFLSYDAYVIHTRTRALLAEFT